MSLVEGSAKFRDIARRENRKFQTDLGALENHFETGAVIVTAALLLSRTCRVGPSVLSNFKSRPARTSGNIVRDTEKSLSLAVATLIHSDGGFSYLRKIR